MRIATIILGRNLPETTDALVERFRAQDTGDNDIYVVESGTQQDRLSKYSTSWANWDDALKNGLRFARGFNFGLLDLIRRGIFADYDEANPYWGRPDGNVTWCEEISSMGPGMVRGCRRGPQNCPVCDGSKA